MLAGKQKGLINKPGTGGFRTSITGQPVLDSQTRRTTKVPLVGRHYYQVAGASMRGWWTAFKTIPADQPQAL